MMKIAEIVPQADSVLFIKADDGRTGYFDVKPYLDSEVFSPLKNQTEFQKITNGRYFVEWSCGADLSADTLFTKWSAK